MIWDVGVEPLLCCLIEAMTGTVWPTNAVVRQFLRQGLCSLPQSRKVKFNRVSDDNFDILFEEREWRPSAKEGLLRHHLQIKRDNEKGMDIYTTKKHIELFYCYWWIWQHSWLTAFIQHFHCFTIFFCHFFPSSRLSKFTVPHFTTKGPFVSEIELLGIHVIMGFNKRLLKRRRMKDIKLRCR